MMRAVAAVAFVVALFAFGALGFQTLEPAVFAAEVVCFRDSDRRAGEPASVECTATRGSTSVSAKANAAGGREPRVDATAQLASGFGGHDDQAESHAAVTYQVTVELIRSDDRPPVPASATIPVSASFLGSVSLGGATPDSGFVAVRLDGTSTVVRAYPRNPSEALDVAPTALLFPAGDIERGQARIVDVGLEVGCSAATAASSCRATAAARLRLDQQSFEAMAQEAGFEPFDLTEFYELSYSPNLLPEPTSGLLGLTMMASVVAIAAIRRRSP